MLHNADEMTGLTVFSTDGEAGTVKDFYFDAHRWTIRYLVVDTGSWLNSKLVLISPMSIVGADISGKSLNVGLTRDQIERSPDIDTAKPVSRQYETEFFDYYGYPYYWAGPQLWGASTMPVASGAAPMPSDAPAVADTHLAEEAHQKHDDPNLQSYAEVRGYDIQATDDTVGHLEDMLIDEQDWSIKLIVIDTRNWLPGKDVLISPNRITSVNWLEKVVTVNATREEVENSVEYDSSMLTDQSALQEVYRQANRRAESGRPIRPRRATTMDR